MAQQTTLFGIFVPPHRVVYKNASNSYERFVNRFVADFTRETQLHGAIAAANALWPSYKDDPKKNSLNFWKEEKRELQLVTVAMAFVSYLKDVHLGLPVEDSAGSTRPCRSHRPA